MDVVVAGSVDVVVAGSVDVVVAAGRRFGRSRGRHLLGSTVDTSGSGTIVGAARLGEAGYACDVSFPSP